MHAHINIINGMCTIMWLNCHLVFVKKLTSLVRYFSLNGHFMSSLVLTSDWLRELMRKTLGCESMANCLASLASVMTATSTAFRGSETSVHLL